MKKTLAALILAVVSFGAASADTGTYPGRPTKSNSHLNRNTEDIEGG